MQFTLIMLAWLGWFGTTPDHAAWLYREGGRTWIERRFDGGRVLGQDARSVLAVRQSLDFYVPALRAITGLDASSLDELTVFCVSDEQLWRRTLGHVGPREDGVAFSQQNNLFIYRPKGQEGSPMRLPHELVHVLLQNSRPLPLWLEEGLACHWSVELVQMRHQVVGTAFIPDYPRFESPAELWPWAQIFTANQLPQDAAGARVFYAQSETAVRLLQVLVGEDGLADLVQRFASARPNDDVLKDFFDARKLDLTDWVLTVEQELFRGR